MVDSSIDWCEDDAAASQVEWFCMFSLANLKSRQVLCNTSKGILVNEGHYMIFEES